ncbi:hypothetical protein DSO57_1024010 [Entomophthora muscae]|uniref:Uncharacterized protein n=3 Tax=Entomophthora muscae TaxID=34485 RepID=A0ACC2U0Q7_9FUNG|nr:hypothetical protein DSO57_1024010 [Entomophthora muscae]
MPVYLRLNKFADSLKDVDIEVQEKDMPEFGKDQALLRVVCASLNATDLFCLAGTYGAFLPKQEPKIPGMECLAIVEGIGSQVTKVKKGQRVIPVLMPDLPTLGVGSWQEYLVISEDRLVAVPDGVSDETAAQFFVNHFTPYAMINNAHLEKGEWIVHNAASGVVGRQIIKLAKHFGLNVVNLVRHKSQVEELEKFGEKNVICTEDFSIVIQELLKITNGQLASAGFDAFGGDNGVIISNALAAGKTAYLYGMMGGLELKAFSHSLLFRGVKYEGFWIIKYMREKNMAEIVEDCKELLSLIKEGVVESLPGIKMDFKQVKRAVIATQSASVSAKVLLVPNLEKKEIKNQTTETPESVDTAKPEEREAKEQSASPPISDGVAELEKSFSNSLTI